MNLFKKFATTASGTLISRLFGFIREILMAAAVGTGPVADAFNAAFRFPNSFRRLFAEGAFNAAFIPLFSKEIEENGLKDAQKFSQEVFGILFTVLLTLTILMEISMPFLVRYLIAPGFAQSPEKFSLTIRFALIMFPYLSCMSLAAMMSGMLNALRHYFAAAIAPVFLNILLIIILFYSWLYGLDPWHIGMHLSWGVLLSGFIQLAIVWFAVKRLGIKITIQRPRFTKNIKRLLCLAFPAAITGGITQINLLINTNIASQKSGAISSLIYADRLYQLPLGVIGIAVATVLLPELSRALRLEDKSHAIYLQNRSLEFTLFLTLPASIAFLIIAKPIVHVIYQHGHFSSQSTVIVSALLSIYALGLPAFVLIKAFVPIFVARENTKTPMIFATISVIVNCSLAFTLFPKLSAKGIAIAEITAAWVNVFLLFATLLKHKHWQSDTQIKTRLCKLFCATLLMGGVLFLMNTYFEAKILSTNLFQEILIIGFMIVSAMLSYFCFVVLFKIIPLETLKTLFKR